MEAYDIVMLVVLIGAALFGAVKGFAWQLASIGSIAVSYMVAYHFREPFSESINAAPPWNRFLAMLILYVGTSLVIWMLFRMVSRTIDRMKLKEFDRQIGALFGLAKGALYCTLITLFAVTLLGDRIREKIVGSRSGHYIAQFLDKSQAVIPPELHEVVQPVLEKFDRRFNDANEPSGGGFLPSWPGSMPGAQPTPADGNSFSEAIFNRLGNSSAAPTNTSPSSPWNGNREIEPPWQSGQSTPIAPSVQAASDRFGRAVDQFGQAVQQGRGAVEQTQQQFNNFRQSTDQLRQSFGRPESLSPSQGSPAPWQR